jgi:hypothetical protein
VEGGFSAVSPLKNKRQRRTHIASNFILLFHNANRDPINQFTFEPALLLGRMKFSAKRGSDGKINCQNRETANQG